MAVSFSLLSLGLADRQAATGQGRD